MFHSASSPKKITSKVLTLAHSRNDIKLSSTGESLGLDLSKRRKEFDARFENTFHLKEKGFGDKQVEFAQFLLSNMLGGIGYFYGSAVVDRSHPPMQDEETFSDEPSKPQFTPPQQLFSATPSRPFFPRGFYW